MSAFRLLGPLEVEVGDRRVRVVGKPAALLVSLLLRHGEAVGGDRLLDELWDERLPKTGRKVLQVNVSQLRKLLGAGRIVTVGSGYAISANEAEVDLWRFERLVADAGRVKADDPSRARDLLDEALGLWRGAPLADLADEPVAAAAAARMEDLRLHAWEERAGALVALGEHVALVPELERLVAEHPFRERLRGLLMVALYRSGRQADALERYRAGRELLAASLGLEPSPALRRLEEQILRHARELDEQPATRESLVLAGTDDDAISLLAPLARTLRRELVLVQPVRDAAGLAVATERLAERRRRLAEDGVAVRVAAFTSSAPADDVAKLSDRPEVRLVLLPVSATRLLALDATAPLLLRAASDVALIRRDAPAPGGGPVVVPFGASDNDWAALELAVALAQAHGVPLTLAGASRNGADASRTLAAASLAVQRVADLVAQPFVFASDAELREASVGATALVAGLPDDWRSRGLGRSRGELVAEPAAPTLFVHRGVRAGILVAEVPLTRFTWSR